MLKPDAWTMYCEIFRELFPNDGAPVLSIATLEEFAERVARSKSAPEARYRDALNAIILRADQRMGSQVSDDVVAIAKAALDGSLPQSDQSQER